MKTSKQFTRHDIIKGASIVAQLQTERQKLVKTICDDKKFYKFRKDKRTLKRMLRDRYARNIRQTINPTRANLARAIRNLSEQLLEECPWYLPCGADDAWYETRDAWRRYLVRLQIAYRYVCWQERQA